MGEAGGGEVSLLQLSPFFAFIFPLFPQKRKTRLATNQVVNRFENGW